MSEEAKPEVTTTEEQPAATEQPAAEEPKTEDQPAVTEVTEVTSEEPAAAAEGESKPAEAEEKKEEEKPKEKPKEEKKKTPKPKSRKPPVDYRTVKEGWIEKPGIFFKSFKRLYMTLDEDGSVLRWWKTEQRTGADGALYIKYCAEVTEPTDQFNTTWPEGTEDRRFVIASPHRAFYLLAENVEERACWIEKLKEAMGKFKKEDVKVITTNPMSVDSLKASIGKAADEGEATLQKEGITKKKEEQPAKTEGEGEAAAATTTTETEEPKPEEPKTAEVTVDIQVETTTTTTTEEPAKTEEPEVTEGEGEKKEEEKPAEEGGDAPKAD